MAGMRKRWVPPADEPQTVPPYYEAAEDLYVGNPESGVAPVCAIRKGGQVPPDLVAVNGWDGKVRVPDVFREPAEEPVTEEPAQEPPAADEPAAAPAAGEE